MTVAVAAWETDPVGVRGAMLTRDVLPDGTWKGSKSVRFYCQGNDGSALRVEYRPDLNQALPWWLIVLAGEETYERALAGVDEVFEALSTVVKGLRWAAAN